MTTPSTDYRLIPLTQGQFAKVDASDYDWLVQWKWCAAWSPRTESFYAVRSSSMKEGKRILLKMHRLILELGEGDKRFGDHGNLDTLDNRRENLRVATHAQNEQNKTKLSNNTSGFKGVSLDKTRGNRYGARIRNNGVSIHLGWRKTAEGAYALYCAASAELHGEFGRTK